MTEKEVNAIKEIVKITIDEMVRQKLCKIDHYPQKLAVVEKELYAFFAGKVSMINEKILHQLSDDEYIDIIFLKYRDKNTIEQIADAMGKDESTIKRNKKRLILSIYELMQERK